MGQSTAQVRGERARTGLWLRGCATHVAGKSVLAKAPLRDYAPSALFDRDRLSGDMSIRAATSISLLVIRTRYDISQWKQHLTGL